MKFDLYVHRIVKQKKENREYIPSHSHEYFHCLYVLGGKGMIEINGSGLPAEKGMFFRFNPGVIHAIYGIDNFQSFDIKFSCSKNLTEALIKLKPVLLLDEYEDSLIKDLFHEAVCDDVYTEEIINARMTELVLRMLRQNKKESITESKLNFKSENCMIKNANILRAVQYIDLHISDNISVADLAEFCGYTQTYFSAFFKNSVGCSPVKYINSKKIERAKELMLTTSYNITQISEQLGVELHNFSKMFKKAVGISPMRYYNRANSDIGINVSKDSPYIRHVDFEIPKALKEE